MVLSPYGSFQLLAVQEQLLEQSVEGCFRDPIPVEEATVPVRCLNKLCYNIVEVWTSAKAGQDSEKLFRKSHF